MRAKLIEGDIIFAPRKMNTTIDGEPYVVFNPPDEMLAADGWLPVRYTEPGEASPGCHMEPGWEEQNGEIVQIWTEVEDSDEISDAEALEIILGGGEA